jgi:GxxExxY protein
METGRARGRIARFMTIEENSPLINTDEHRYAHSELTQIIIGTFYEVYNELGYGFIESVYESALCIALRTKGLRVERQFPVPVWFRGEQIGSFFADLVVNKSVILELKAARALEPAFIAQLLNYLRATPVEVGLILNFGPRPNVRRLLFTNDRKKNQCSSVFISGQ